jgi:prophage maintenance system killer protein
MENEQILFFTSEDPVQRKKLQRKREAGELRPLRQGIYVSTAVVSEQAVRRHWLELINYLTDGEGHLSHRSVFSPQPGAETWFVSVPAVRSGVRNEIIYFPGVRVVLLAGMKQPDRRELQYMGQTGLISTVETAFLEVTEDRRGAYRDALVGQSELEFLLFKHRDQINKKRLQELALQNDRSPDDILTILDAIEQGNDQQIQSKKLKALLSNQDYDPNRFEMFTRLSEHLAQKTDRPIPRRPWSSEAKDQWNRYCFIAAYFSNYVEGTRFPPQTAMDKIRNGVDIGAPPEERTLVGTYRTYQSLRHNTIPVEFGEFEDNLKMMHRSLAEENQNLRPGKYKIEPNSAGSYTFVQPGRVRSTLRAGWELGQEIQSPFYRAFYLGFVVSEIHPFTDGNGRLARLVMDQLLINNGFSGFIVTPRTRNFYLTSLRAISRELDVEKYTTNFIRIYKHYVDLSVRSDEAMVEFCEKENLDEEANSFIGVLKKLE